ncbi:hypothetical protein ABW19_dt0208532 [Dactylella cylindrospora]|nr:hypothetical protein ABW19_dt0208532 [Dactylella cylindrospora]
MMSEPLATEGMDQNNAQSAENPAYNSDLSNAPSHSRERDRIQDIYRKSLAASWQLQTGELNAVDCIENIFAGGDGWAVDWEQRQAGNETLRSYSTTEETDMSGSNAETYPRSSRPSGSRSSTWHQSTDTSGKRSRAPQNYERGGIDIPITTANYTQGPRLTGQPAHKTGVPRPGFATARSQPTGKYVSTGQSGGPLVDSGGPHLDRSMTLNQPHFHGWSSSTDITEEDLRENLVSWSLS